MDKNEKEILHDCLDMACKKMERDEIIVNCLDEAVDKMFKQLGKDDSLSFADLHKGIAEMWVKSFYSPEDLRREVEDEIEILEGREIYYKELIAEKDDDKNEKRKNSLAEVLGKKERLIESLKTDDYIGEGFWLAVYSLMSV